MGFLAIVFSAFISLKENLQALSVTWTRAFELPAANSLLADYIFLVKKLNV